MLNIEEQIRKNLELLSDEEPRDGHNDRFLQKLNDLQIEQPESWFSRYSIALRLAAAIIVFFTIGTLYYTTGFSGLANLLTNQLVAADLPPEVEEVIQYYSAITNKKVGQIDDLAVSENQATKIKAMVNDELNALEVDRKDLEAEYARNPNNKRIVNAMLVNQQKKSQLIDKILKTLKQVN